MTLPIPPGFYSNIINGYYGNLSSQEQQRLWDTFVDNYGIKIDTQDSVQLQTTFAQFIKGYYAKEVQNESQTALTPDEYRSRLILFNTYQSVTQMLDTLQNTVAVQGNALMHYGRWQEEYTKILSRIPTLSSGKAGTVVANTTDLSSFTFGSYKFSMTDIINWGVTNAIKKIDPTGVFQNGVATFQNVTKKDGLTLTTDYTFYVDSSVPGKQTLKMYIYPVGDRPIQDNGSYAITPIAREFLISSNNPSDTVYDTFDKQVAKATSLWQEILNTPTSQVLGTTIGYAQTASNLWAALLASPLPARLNTLDAAHPLDSFPNIQTQLTQAVQTVLSGPDGGSTWIQAAGSPWFKYWINRYGDSVRIEVHYTNANSDIAVGTPAYNLQDVDKRVYVFPPAPTSPSIATVLNGATTILMPGRYLGDAPTDLADPAVGGNQSVLEANIKLNDADTKSRAEVNAVLQQYIENIRSLRDTVAQKSKALQAALGQDKTTLTGQTDLMTAILDSIDSIMQQIFKAGGK